MLENFTTKCLMESEAKYNLISPPVDAGLRTNGGVSNRIVTEDCCCTVESESIFVYK